MICDLNKRRIIEYQKAKCREKIAFHAKNVALQSVISFMCFIGGMYAGQKRSVWVPLFIAPTAAASVSKLATHESKRRRYKEILNELEKG